MGVVSSDVGAERPSGGRALLVIDMLNDFLEEQGALYCGPAARAILPFVARKIGEAREAGDLVVFVCDRHTPDDREFEMFPPHCVAGTAGAGVAPELIHREGDIVVPKRRFSAFYGTDLDLHLRERAVKEVVLVGVCTNICVLYTAADARMRNYEVTVLRDGVASFDEDAHRFALKEMEKVLGARVI
jgi:nicotinamidase-related amidase